MYIDIYLCIFLYISIYLYIVIYIGCFVCVYDKNYALVIVTQQRTRGIYNQIWQDKLVLISHSNKQKHFSLKLSGFGEPKS